MIELSIRAGIAIAVYVGIYAFIGWAFDPVGITGEGEVLRRLVAATISVGMAAYPYEEPR